MYPKYQIASDGSNWQIIEITIAKEGKNAGKEVKRPISYPSNIEHAAQLIREKWITAKCYGSEEKLTVEKILEAISESNAVIRAAIEDLATAPTK